MSLWGGRFAQGQHPAFEAFNRSLPFDRRLWQADLIGSRAWARAQVAAGSLSAEEGARIEAALASLEAGLSEDDSPLERSKTEDVHAFVEEALVGELGDLGKKLHVGRSRNDQVATDLRLWCKERARELDEALRGLQMALVELARQQAGTPMPGYTHLQRAQILTLGHHALAYVEMLERDRSRLAEALARLDECPLGSGALAGTFLPIDREALAADLGFARPTRNSLDAVSDRDFVAELLFVATLSGAHLSRFAEDWIFFCSQEAGFLELGEDVSTGSSLMPQKKNPDSLELVRGKGARILGRLTGFLSCLRSLPLAYDKDLQEDKEALFEALDTWEACLAVTRLCVQSVRVDGERLREACRSGYLDATELAGLLVEAGVPFREAHDQVGRLVRAAIDLGVELRDLPAGSCAGIAPAFDEGMRERLDPERILRERQALGAAGGRQVTAEAARWHKRLTREAKG